MHPSKRQAMRERPPRLNRAIAQERIMRPSRTILWIAPPTRRIADPETATNGSW